ncbi:MAG: XdhC family protein [Ferruginibacter sp.]
MYAKQLLTWQFIGDSLQRNVGVLLLYVLESKSSSPGRQGFFMAVNTKGEMRGSIGGGIMEHKFVELAKSKLKEAVDEVSIHHQLHDKTAAKNQSGMICSGEQTLFLYTVQSKDIIPVTAIIDSLKNNRSGQLQLSPGGIYFSEDIPAKNFSFKLQPDGNFIYTEKTGYKNHLYIIGGGHCALAFSQLMSSMDFFIHVFDDRLHLNTLEQNQYAHEIKYVGDYNELSTLIPAGDNCYAVIMTFGYRTDEIALKALLEKDIKYLGILGSKTKISKMFKVFTEEGISPTRLEKVHAPVGIQIKSQTPQEIAISIAAEIIQVKNDT